MNEHSLKRDVEALQAAMRAFHREPTVSHRFILINALVTFRKHGLMSNETLNRELNGIEAGLAQRLVDDIRDISRQLRGVVQSV